MSQSLPNFHNLLPYIPSSLCSASQPILPLPCIYPRQTSGCSSILGNKFGKVQTPFFSFSFFFKSPAMLQSKALLLLFLRNYSSACLSLPLADCGFQLYPSKVFFNDAISHNDWEFKVPIHMEEAKLEKEYCR